MADVVVAGISNSAADNLIIGLATAIGTVVIMLATLAVWRVTQRSRRKEELEAHISAEINRHYREITDLSNRAQQLHDESRGIHAAVAREQKQLAKDREDLDRLRDELDVLRTKWGSLVPTMEAIEDSPDLLRVTAAQQLEQARQSDDPERAMTAMKAATAFLRRLLQHTDAETRNLELAGDFAREQLGSPSLARQLYERAVDADSANLSAYAELQALRIRSPSERDDAVNELQRLVEEHPATKSARVNLFNYLVENEKWRDLESTCRRLISLDESDSFAWRNLAVALTRLTPDSDEIPKAYEKAFELARAKRDTGDFANSARSFGGYIRDYGSVQNLPLALQRLNEAIVDIADDASLHVTRGTILFKLGDTDGARACYELASRIGNTREQEYSAMSLRRLEILSAFHLDGQARDNGAASGSG